MVKKILFWDKPQDGLGHPLSLFHLCWGLVLSTLLTGWEHPWMKPDLWTHLCTSGFNLSPCLPWGKKHRLLSLCCQGSAQSDHLLDNGSAPAPKSWADGEHHDGRGGQACKMGLVPSAGGAGKESLGLTDPAEALPACQGCDLICRQWGKEERSGIAATGAHGASSIFILDLRFSPTWIKTRDSSKKQRCGEGKVCQSTIAG